MKLIVLTAPSGAGKTTIARCVMGEMDGLRFSVSAITRPRREDEEHGVDYFFLNEDEFRKKIEADAFIEYEEVYPGLFYGTLKNELERLAESTAVLLDIDVVGALNVKKLYGKLALTLFICPPSLEILEQRLLARRTDSADDIAIRLDKAALELSQANQFDEVIVNDDLEQAVAETLVHIRAFVIG